MSSPTSATSTTSTTQSGSTPSFSDGAVKTFTFGLAALILLGMSKILPTPSALLAIAITIGVVFKNSKQLTTISNRISSAFATSSSNSGNTEG